MAIGRSSCYLATRERFVASWYHVDAADKVLGRLATRIAMILMGKHKPTYTAHVDTGDYVVVTNAEKIKITGAKLDEIIYPRYSFYPGGYKAVTARQMMKSHPERVLRFAVKRMLPKSALGRHMLDKLKVYAGGEHPHQAQCPEPLELTTN